MHNFLKLLEFHLICRAVHARFSPLSNKQESRRADEAVNKLNLFIYEKQNIQDYHAIHDKDEVVSVNPKSKVT
jgi:hypothetical protein